jgi:3-oxoisoapionate decarboxylase
VRPARKPTSLGISSWAYPWSIGVPGHLPGRPLDAFGLIDLASTLGVDLVQIADNLPLDKLSDSDLARLSRHAAAANIGVEVGTFGLTKDRLGSYLRIAKLLEASLVRIVIDQPGFEPDETKIVDSLSAVCGAFEAEGVRIAIENHDRFSAPTLARIVESVGSPSVGICLDTVNSMAQPETVAELLTVLRPWIINVHIKDFSVTRVANKMGFTVAGAPAGEGRLDIPALLGEIGELPQHATVILELWPPFKETLETTIQQERAWVQRSVAFLKGCGLGSKFPRAASCAG